MRRPAAAVHGMTAMPQRGIIIMCDIIINLTSYNNMPSAPMRLHALQLWSGGAGLLLQPAQCDAIG